MINFHAALAESTGKPNLVSYFQIEKLFRYYRFIGSLDLSLHLVPCSIILYELNAN